jgi:hypothetical protein
VAKVDKITGDQVERFRGILDFYMYKGKIPVVRKWPNKINPPYTVLQETAMAVFSLACSLMSRITPNMLNTWRIGTEGVRNQWTDVWKGLFMKYWKLKGTLPLIALDFRIIETETKWKVEWDTLEVFLDPDIDEILTTYSTVLILKSDIKINSGPIYFTFIDDDGLRQIAPYIKFEG